MSRELSSNGSRRPHRARRYYAAAIWAVALSAALGACRVEVSASRGDLAINYSFDGDDCVAVGVDTIDLIVTAREGSTSRTTTSSCAHDSWQVTLLDLPEGDYDVDVEGYDASGALLYDGHAIITVVGGTLQEYDLVAPPSEGSLAVYWTFAGSDSCLDVYDVHLLLVDPFGDIYDEAIYPCDYGGITYDSLIAGRWLVSLYALDAYGGLLYAAEDRPVLVEAYSHNERTVDF